jgi:hypothetical protein
MGLRFGRCAIHGVRRTTGGFMLTTLLTLTALLTNKGVLSADQTQSLAEDAAYVAEHEEPLFSGNREKTARLLVVWAARESAGQVAIMGDCSDPKKKSVDTCRSFGRMQTSKQWLMLLGLTTESVMLDGRESLRAGLAVMRRLRDQCGSVRAGLRAYASGSCVGSMRARTLVESRCKEIDC